MKIAPGSAGDHERTDPETRCPEDVPEIRALTLRAYARWQGVTLRPPRPVTADYARAFCEHRFDLLVDRGQIIALIETIPEGNELLIVNVALDPGRQGEGHGVRLMCYAEALAREGGLRGTRLYINKLMTANIALYERLGYRFERETLHEQGTVAVHMVRALVA